MRTLMIVTALTAAILGANARSGGAQESTPGSTTPVIVTTGAATVQRAPDVAFITVTVESRAKSPREAQQLNAESMAAVQRRLADARIAREALRTLGLSLDQEFDMANGRRTPRGFVARNVVEVRVDDVSRIGEIADVVVAAGATSLGGIRFDLRDRAAAEHEALRQAVQDARARADAAAAGAGRSIDRVLRIEDLRAEIAPPRPIAFARAAESAPATDVSPGTIDVHARVTLTVSIR